MAVRIYTRTGDDGSTHLFGGARVRKDDIRVEAYGTVDELNSALGVAAFLAGETELTAELREIQADLLTLGADLSTPMGDPERRGTASITRLSGGRVTSLEQIIDRHESDLPPLTQFILPGGTAAASALHVARTVCRRAERRCVALADSDGINPVCVQYLNRLSDLLFVMARSANHRAGRPDILWQSPASKEQE